MTRRDREAKQLVVTFLAPAVLLYGGFVLLPALAALRYSLLRWDGLSAPSTVGLSNFAAVLRRDSPLVGALGHNVYLTLVPGVIILALALFFAYSIHQRIRGARIFRIAFFFPNIISGVAIAELWVLLYSTTGAGLINNLLKHFFGLKEAIPFAQSDRLLPALVPLIVWSATGFYMLLFLAAMENIPEEFYEAARLDGAGSFTLFCAVTLPLIWDVLTTGIIFLIIGGLKTFDAIWIMENGRPNKDTHVLSTLMYSKVFEEYNIGYGTAIAVVLFLFTLTCALLSRRFLQREALEY